MDATKPVVAAIDVGYGHTKFTSSLRATGRCESFPSIAPATKDRDLSAALGKRRRTAVIEIDGVSYEVGPEAHLAEDVFSVRNMDDAYCTTPEYLALTRGALHYLKLDKIDLLVVGLPVSTYASKRRYLEKRLCGDHLLGGERRSQVARVRVLAQPHGALLNFAAQTNQLASIKSARNLIIDPGARTFDWLVTDGLKIVEKRSAAVNRGMVDVLNAIAAGISKSLDTSFRDLDRIDTALRSGTNPIVFQQEQELKPHLPAARKIARDAITDMKRLVQDGNDIDHIILSGGGAFFFKPLLDEAFPRHTIHELKDGIYSNVIGFKLFGVECLNIKPADSREADRAEETVEA